MNHSSRVLLEKWFFCFSQPCEGEKGNSGGMKSREPALILLTLPQSSIFAILLNIGQLCGNTRRSISHLLITHSRKMAFFITCTHKIAWFPLPLLLFSWQQHAKLRKFFYLRWRFSTNSHTFLRRLSALYVNIMAAWSWSVVSSEEMVAVSATLVSHTQSLPKPPVASLRRCLHVCKQADSHLCTKIILTHDSLLLYILAALNYEICWCVFIVFQYNLSLWQQTTQADRECIIWLISVHISWYTSIS